MAQDYRELKLWQKANELSRLCYMLVKTFPETEKYGLAGQMNRSALSVPANIVEGFYRGKKEFVYFLRVSMGSLKETEYFIMVAHERDYISKVDYDRVMGLTDEVSRLIATWQRQLTSSNS